MEDVYFMLHCGEFRERLLGMIEGIEGTEEWMVEGKMLVDQ